MKIILTCSELLWKSNDWLLVCDELGLSEWCCKEGYGDTEVHLTEEQAKKYGVIKC